jgi:hypothetical protein
MFPVEQLTEHLVSIGDGHHSPFEYRNWRSAVGHADDQ